MAQFWKTGRGKVGDTRENLPTVVRRDSHMRKSGSGPAGNRTHSTFRSQHTLVHGVEPPTLARRISHHLGVADFETYDCINSSHVGIKAGHPDRWAVFADHHKTRSLCRFWPEARTPHSDNDFMAFGSFDRSRRSASPPLHHGDSETTGGGLHQSQSGLISGEVTLPPSVGSLPITPTPPIENATLQISHRLSRYT
ncbi:hypothetical protein PR048_006077 [Dryococelus australis]|uniref:Uncharacterized protein n=1 Tax=Dryococelus australis TaxID=614101 RepID=A0ABQ9I9Z2_9NEOP|nr:hypothetical protein PR048_006077 [Dryococelus australis]